MSTGYKYFLNPTRRRSGGPGALYLRVVHDGDRRMVSTGYRLYEHEWDAAAGRIIHPHGRGVRSHQLFAIENDLLKDTERMERAIAELESGGMYTIDRLMAHYRSVTMDNTLLTLVERLASRMAASGHPGTAGNYRKVAARLVSFHGRRDLSPEQITPELLSDFEQALRSQGHTPSTVSSYMRLILAIRKRLMAGEGTAGDECGFDEQDASTAPTRRTALTDEELEALMALDPTLPGPGTQLRRHQAQALAVFLFCYHGGGMSFIDAAHLRKSDVRDGTITYRCRQTGQRIEVPEVKEMRRIVDWFSPLTAGGEYLLPVIDADGDNPVLQYESALSRYNKRLKSLARECGIKTTVTTQTAYHTWAARETVVLPEVPAEVPAEVPPATPPETDTTTTLHHNDNINAMITKEEYIAARTVVEEYHRQTTEAIRQIDHAHNASLKSFLNNVDMSERLRNALNIILLRSGNVRLEDIRPDDIAKIPRVGIKSAEEFQKKQWLYLNADRSV